MSCAGVAGVLRTAVALCIDAGWYCPSAAKITIRLIRILAGECVREIVGGGTTGGGTTSRESIGVLVITNAVLAILACAVWFAVWFTGYFAARALAGVIKLVQMVPASIRAALAALFVMVVAVATIELAAAASRDADVWRAYAN